MTLQADCDLDEAREAIGGSLKGVHPRAAA